MPVNTRICIKCEASVSPPEEIFCHQCGERIVELPTQSTEQVNSQPSKLDDFL